MKILTKKTPTRTFDTLSESPDVRYACIDYTIRDINIKEFDEELYDLGGGWFQYHTDYGTPIKHLLAVIDWSEEATTFFILKYGDVFPTITTAKQVRPLFNAVDYLLDINPLHEFLQDPLKLVITLIQHNIRKNEN